MFKRCFRKCFIEHPESVGENYFTHGIKALYFGSVLFIYGTCEVLHAIVPGIDIFKLRGTTSVEQLENLCDQLRERKKDD